MRHGTCRPEQEKEEMQWICAGNISMETERISEANRPEINEGITMKVFMHCALYL